MPRLRALLNALAIGILVFLLWDVLAAAWEPVDKSVSAHAWLPALRDGAILAAGTGLGLLGLVYFDRWVGRRAGGGSAATELSLLIAIGIGLHNFAEGLAIGNQAAAGELQLALMLVI